jgi:hypothetical protein
VVTRHPINWQILGPPTAEGSAGTDTKP